MFMSIRNRVVLTSRKLGFLSFFGTFVYVFIAKVFNGDYGLVPEYAVFFFFATFFFLGLMTVPTNFGRGQISSWLFPCSFFLASFGGFMLFGRLIIFHTTLEDSTAIYGGILFMLSIMLMLGGAIASSPSSYRNVNDIKDVKDAFDKVVKQFNLLVKNVSVPERFELIAQGETPNGHLYLNVKNDLKLSHKFFNSTSRRGRNLINTSILKLKQQNVKVISIVSVNEAVEINGVSEKGEVFLRGFIKEKQLDYFNFHLSSSESEVTIISDIAIEEEALWLDYIELMNLVTSAN